MTYYELVSLSLDLLVCFIYTIEQNDMATMVQKQVSKQLEREVLTRRTRQTGAVLKDRSSKKKYTLSRILLH